MMAVFLAYMQDPDITIRQAWESTRIDGPESALAKDVISLPRTAERATRDGWPDRRAAHWRHIQGRVLAYAASDAVGRELDELDKLNTIWAEGLKRMTGEDAVGANTFEGMASAMIRLDKHRSDKRQRISDATAAAATAAQAAAPAAATATGTGSLGPAVPDLLEEAEYTALARQIAAKRAVAAPVTVATAVAVEEK